MSSIGFLNASRRTHPGCRRDHCQDRCARAVESAGGGSR
jgi:hypothetical protein